MHFEEHEKNVMRYFDGEMEARQRAEFTLHLETCESCRNALEEMSALKEVTDSMKLAELPEAVWEKYWNSVYNTIERSVAWFLFICGALILSGYWVYRVITEPGITTIVGLGGMLMLIGFAILLLSVLREKLTVNKSDRYISEVKR